MIACISIGLNIVKVRNLEFFVQFSQLVIIYQSFLCLDETECATNRGSCPQICLPVSSSTSSFKQCVCQDHYKYISQNNSCVKVTDPGNLLLLKFFTKVLHLQ